MIERSGFPGFISTCDNQLFAARGPKKSPARTISTRCPSPRCLAQTAFHLHADRALAASWILRRRLACERKRVGGPRAPEQSSNALWAARNAGVKHVVRMSAIGAAHDAPTINGRLHGLSDAELIGSGIPYTIVKPHFFMQNLLMAAESIAQQGVMHLPLADSRMGLIDSRDISEFSARVLAGEGHEGKSYTLTGPASITMTEAASAIGEAIGKQVRYEPVSLEATWQSMVQMGMDEWTVNLLCDYFAAYSTNWGDLVTDDYRSVVGKAPRSIAEFAGDFAGAFGKR